MPASIQPNSPTLVAPAGDARLSTAFLLPLFFILLLLVAHRCPVAVVSLALTPLLPRDVRIEGLRTNTERDLVVDVARPAFSWHLDTEVAGRGEVVPGVHQVRYELDIALAHNRSSNTRCSAHSHSNSDPHSSSFHALDSVATARTTHVRHNGPALQPDCRYTWRLRYQSSTGRLSEWAEGFFRTGLMPALNSVSPFEGVWIGSRAIHMNQLRREFAVPASLQSASVFLSGIGLYELYVNGQRVDDSRRLDPGWTEYARRSLYVSFELTGLLTAGQVNCLGVLLGNGWYAAEQWGIWSPVMVNHAEYGPARLLLQLNLHLSDGSVQSVLSDEQWKGREGPLVHDGVYFGEVVEERNERSGWSSAGFTDHTSLWLPVEELPSPVFANGTLSLQSMPPIRIGAGALHTDLLGMQQVDWKGERGADEPLGAPITAVTIQPVYTSPATGVDVFDLQVR